MLRRARLRLGSFWSRRRREQEFEEEIRFHLSEETEERVAQGLDLDRARAAANRDFGNVTLVREAAREVWAWASAERLVRDVQYALRTMRRAPGYSAVAVVTLALGIGANTAIFSLVNGILLRPLPYPEPERLVSVTGTYPRGAFVELRAASTLMQVAAYAEGHGVNLSGSGEPVRLTATLVSAELLGILGARPALGRTFQPMEDVAGRDGYAILSHTLWEQRFARDPAIVGRSIVLDGVHRQVVGVMPADFRFPSPKTQIWIPLHIDPRTQTSYWASDFMPVVARLRAGVTLDRARAEVRQVQARLPPLFPWPMPAAWNADVTVESLQDAVVGDTRERLLILAGVVALVLLIACANVANLSLARAVSRTKEIAVRCALGAGPSRIARQVLTESVVLAVCGAALGLTIATQGLAPLKRVLPADTPRLDDVQADWRVLAFTAALAVITGLAFGLAPALQAGRTALTESMNAGGRSAAGAVGRRLRGALVVSEIALAVLLVTAAGLFIRSFRALSLVNAGFRPERVVTARITPSPGFCTQETRCLAFYDDVLDRLRGLPGARGAALTHTVPLDGRVAKRSLALEGRSLGGDPLVWMNVVTPGYFRVMGIPIVAGRPFADADRSGAPVALLSAATARRFWPENEAIGRQIRFVGETRWRTIVGVVGDVRAHDLRHDVPDWMDGTIYVPYAANATLENGRIPAEMSVTLLTDADAPDAGARMREVVGTVSAEVPVSDVRAMDAVLAGAVASPASVTTLVASFGVLALALGAIGIYGVLSFLVSRRTRDIGIQMALGARRADVFRSIMKEGAQLALTGVGLGMAAALIATRILQGELYGVDPADPLTYVIVAAVMVTVTMGACAVPTYRATRVDALIALRQE